MNNKIEYILVHNRFPFTKVDWAIMIIIAVLIIAGMGFVIYTYPKPLYIVLALLLGGLSMLSIYKGYTYSMDFKKIISGLPQAQNVDIITYSLNQLNFRIFKDQQYENVFVCFIHEKNTHSRQEIYIVAKDDYILINSDKNKSIDDENGPVDFVNKIGMTIYQNITRLRIASRNK